MDPWHTCAQGGVRGGLPPSGNIFYDPPPGLFFDPTPVKNFDPLALNSSWPALHKILFPKKNFLGLRPKIFFNNPITSGPTHKAHCGIVILFSKKKVISFSRLTPPDPTLEDFFMTPPWTWKFMTPPRSFDPCTPMPNIVLCGLILLVATKSLHHVA